MEIIGVGRFTRNPEMKYTTTKKAMCSFSLAVDYGFGEKKRTEFLNFTAWEKQAELVNKYCGKGDLIFVRAEPTLNKWEGSDGNDKSTLKFTVRDIKFLQKSNKPSEIKADSKGACPTNATDYDDDILPF